MSLLGSKARLTIDKLPVSEENKDIPKSSTNSLITAAKKIAVLKSKNPRQENKEIA